MANLLNLRASAKASARLGYSVAMRMFSARPFSLSMDLIPALLLAAMHKSFLPYPRSRILTRALLGYLARSSSTQSCPQIPRS
jgi:hypothetical protein